MLVVPSSKRVMYFPATIFFFEIRVIQCIIKFKRALSQKCLFQKLFCKVCNKML